MIEKIDKNKLKGLMTAAELLDGKYGKEGTPSREVFQQNALGWYYGVILRDRRKEKKLTQQQLADVVGVKRSYIARIEKEVSISSALMRVEYGSMAIATIYLL
jgi:HTH-type transcriptional regulator / antitoxin HipB